MIDNEIIYNKEYLVILPVIDSNLKEEFEYTFKNVFLFNEKKDSVKQIKTIKKSHFKQIIFVDYCVQYKEIINNLEENQIYKIIFTKDLGAFSEEKNYDLFSNIMSLIEDYNIKKVGFLDYNLYSIFRSKIKCCHISLDIKQVEPKLEFDKNKIGLLNDEENPMHSFYNELSALKFNNNKAVLNNYNKTTKEFLKMFKIKHTKSKDNMSGNLLNLYINFTDNNNITFIRSMDKGVPCILGNNELLKGSTLEKFLSVESDDSVDEINEKIELVEKNRKEILEEYKTFREDYKRKSEKEIREFLDYSIELKEEKKYDKLLTIVVPVYNVENYVGQCLKSIIASLPKKIVKDTEILIINDGSTDNSESVIMPFKEKYKDLIVYIKQKNGGLGHVRNVALEKAKGKYIASIDSDDTINKNFFKDVLKAIEKDADIFICDWLTKTNTNKYETSAIEYGIFDNISKYEGLIYSSIMPSTCNKVFKKELFDELKISYLEEKFEDLSTNPFLLLKAQTIYYVHKPYYEYYIRSDSIMRSSIGLSMIDVLKEFNNRLNKYSNYCTVDIDLFKFYTISWRMEQYIFNQLYNLTKKEKDNMIKYLYNNLYDEVIDMFSNNYYKEMINSFKDDKKEYILKRNKAFKDKKLNEFKMNKQEFKLTAPIIYFGDK